MTIFQRPDEVVFSEQALPGEIDDFPNVARGWGEALELTDGKPALEWFNWLGRRVDRAVRYFMQRGVSEWSATEDYPEGAMVMHRGLLFRADAENVNREPVPGSPVWGGLRGLTPAADDSSDRFATTSFARSIAAEFAMFAQIGAEAASRDARSKMAERVSVDDFFRPDLGDRDHTRAFERANAYLRGVGGGVIELPAPSYVSEFIESCRNVQIVGKYPGGSELKQAPGVNADFIVSENFGDLTGSGLDVAGDPRVPSWFGLSKVRVNGNRSGNTAGRAIAFYGASPILDDVLVTDSAEDGVYTEYAASITGLSGWRAQEEGYVRNLTVRGSGGVGWRNRGPHNVYIDNAIYLLNDDWGYLSEIDGNRFNGAPTYVSVMHGYSNDMQWRADSGRVRRNMLIGTNMSCGLLVVDGGHAEVRGSATLIGVTKQYLGGQGGDALLLSGSNIQIGSHYGIMRNDGAAEGSAVLRISGNFNQIGTSNISGTANRFDGVAITGVGNAIGDLVAQNCRVGLTVSGSRNRVRGYLGQNKVGLAYQRPTDVHGGFNRLDLQIYQPLGVHYVTGDAPYPDRDRFDIVANGMPIGRQATRTTLEVGALPIDVTTIQEVNVPHGMPYAPRRRDVQVTQTGMVGGSVAEFAWGPRVSTTDATNVTVQYKMRVAAPEGSQLSFAVQINLS